MSAFTNLTADLWTWDEWRNLEHDVTDLTGRCAKLFWLALYTSHDAKRIVPGLFGGSIHAMAECAGMPVDDALKYLDRLLEHDLVEFDRNYRILRLTKLPGFGDAAGSNGKVIRGWWNQFKKVPACPVRDAHVTTLRWMLDEWSRYTGKPLSNDHNTAWADTFGRVDIPAPRRRGVRRFMDSDTGTPEQPSLFDPRPSHPSGPSGSGSSGSLSVGRGDGSDSLSGTPCDSRDANSVDKSVDSANPNKIIVPETLSKGFRNPWDPDPEPDQDQVFRSSEGGSGGGRPALALVPAANSFDADDLVDALATGTERCANYLAGRFPRAVTREQRMALGRAIAALGPIDNAPAALALLREYVAAGAPDLDFRDIEQLTLSQRAAGMGGITLDVVIGPGWLDRVFGYAGKWAEKRAAKQREHDDYMAAWEEAKRQGGMK